VTVPKKPRATPAILMSAEISPVKAVDVMPVLLSELQKAEQIILAMLNAMTSPQKSKVHARLDAAGVSGEGMTRHHERRAVIDAAEAVSAQIAIVHAQSKPPDLSPAEMSLLMAFRTMWERGASETLDLALWEAETNPRRTAPSLQLISGGKS
jgi:hypothetical protein